MAKKIFSNGDLFVLPVVERAGFVVGQIILGCAPGQYFVAIASNLFDRLEDAARFDVKDPEVALSAVVLDEYLLSGEWEVFSNGSVWSSVSFPVYKVLTPQGFVVENIDRTLCKECTREQAAVLSNRRVISAAALRRVVSAHFGFGSWREVDNGHINGVLVSEDQFFGTDRSSRG